MWAINTSRDFAGTTLSNSNYPVHSYPNSYIQWSNYGTGHSENVTGRFGAIVPVVGIQEITKSLNGNNISLYPNPAQNSTNLYFRLGLEGCVKITICNAIGQVIELSQLNNIEPNTTLNIATSCWAEGLYFVNIQNETRSESIKFINLSNAKIKAGAKIAPA